jgi:hypothetical protein
VDGRPLTAPLPGQFVVLRLRPQADGLFFLPPPAPPQHARPRPGAPARRSVEAVFCGAFRAVWARLPEPDRQVLLRYWRAGPEGHRPGGPPAPPTARPLIRLADVGRWSPPFSTCDGLGHHLTFPTSLVTEHEALLPAVIARTLALALRYATRAHWALYLKVIDGPMDRWEARHGKRATDAARDARLGRLEGAYLRAYEEEVAQILRGWGFAPPKLGWGHRGDRPAGVNGGVVQPRFENGWAGSQDSAAG